MRGRDEEADWSATGQCVGSPQGSHMERLGRKICFQSGKLGFFGFSEKKLSWGNLWIFMVCQMRNEVVFVQMPRTIVMVFTCRRTFARQNILHTVYETLI